MDINKLLSRLERVKQTGQGRYIARCPSHDDKGPSLVVTQADDKILLHCFAGCEVSSILDSVGMELHELFPERPLTNRKQSRFNAYDVLKCLEREAIIIMLAAGDCEDVLCLHAGAVASHSLSEQFAQTMISIGMMVGEKVVAIVGEGFLKSGGKLLGRQRLRRRDACCEIDETRLAGLSHEIHETSGGLECEGFGHA